MRAFYTFAEFSVYAKQNPHTRIRVSFQVGDKRGAAVYPAEHVLAPCKSMRFFPPDGTNVAELGWGRPWWYHHEIVGLTIAA